MEVLYHGIKTRYAYDFPLCFPHELLMSLRNIYSCDYSNDKLVLYNIFEPFSIEMQERLYPQIYWEGLLKYPRLQVELKHHHSERKKLKK